MMLPTIWQNDAFRTFLKETGYTKFQWNDGLKDYLVFILSASPYLTLNDLLKLYYNTYGTWEIQFTPDDLFILGQYGLWWDASSTNYITQDSAGTIPVTIATDPVGSMIDRSGNGNDGIQATTSLKPLYQTTPSRIVFDKVDDQLSTTLSSEINGTLMMSTAQGIIHCEISVPLGVYTIPSIASRFTGNNFIQLILRDGALSVSEEIFIKDYLGNGIYTPVGSLRNGFAARSDITKIYASNWVMQSVTDLQSFISFMPNLTFIDCSEWDISSVTTLSGFSTNSAKLEVLNTANWSTNLVSRIDGFTDGCSKLTQLDVRNWNVSLVTNADFFIRNCPLLTSLDLSNWELDSLLTASAFADGCSSLNTVIVDTTFSNNICDDYENAFRGCALNQDSVDAILVSINNAGTSNGILGIQGGTNATPSIIGQVATDALRTRGWTVTLNGY